MAVDGILEKELGEVLGALVLALLKPMTDEQRVEARDALHTQAVAAGHSGRKKTARILAACADAAEVARRMYRPH
jgi:hypothetical protein